MKDIVDGASRDPSRDTELLDLQHNNSEVTLGDQARKCEVMKLFPEVDTSERRRTRTRRSAEWSVLTPWIWKASLS